MPSVPQLQPEIWPTRPQRSFESLALVSSRTAGEQKAPAARGEHALRGVALITHRLTLAARPDPEEDPDAQTGIAVLAQRFAVNSASPQPGSPCLSTHPRPGEALLPQASRPRPGAVTATAAGCQAPPARRPAPGRTGGRGAAAGARPGHRPARRGELPNHNPRGLLASGRGGQAGAVSSRGGRRAPGVRGATGSGTERCTRSGAERAEPSRAGPPC